MDFSDDSFDFILDKGTLDALLSSQNFCTDIALYFSEVERILKIEGYFIVVSVCDPSHLIHHFKREHLDF